MKIFRFLLFPFAILYDAVTRIRNFFFDIGVFKETTFNIPVIVVGNLSVGGTGKTPQIEYLIRLLKDNYKVGVLSRGYKRKTKGFVLLNSTHTAAEVGDEPLQYFKKFSNIALAVNANRVEGIFKLCNLKNPDVILLDDAYQHRKVKGSFYVLLTKYNDLFIDDFLLPTGNLRESKKGANRSNAILVTKCPKNITAEEQRVIKNKLSKYNKPVFFTTIKYAETTLGSQQIQTEKIKDFSVLLITGIAHTEPLTNYLLDLKVNFEHLKFSDHHHFSEEEIDKIQKKFDKIQAEKKMILTTEKDYVRLINILDDLSYLAIETSFLNEQSKTFSNLINLHLNGNN
ncbi:tetraacyldisaccharide 4'-kinase [uncultured Polaribacter sp.]|uniref:tetraacyldisaccharide 4'-kinase n=1 Tax=uncultured Polaribacter sp. TaxID=174711 RepID=UPI00261197C1|nr:tetraacyldisaccharide 4'-kinase [uncultured Polaribacter sp.]